MGEDTFGAPQGRKQPLPSTTVGMGSDYHQGKDKALYNEFARHEKACRSAASFSDLAKQVLLLTGDTTYAGLLVSKALVLSNDFEAHLTVAETICRDLLDLNWGRNVYRRILDRYNSAEKREAAAGSILRILNDRSWAERIYEELERSAKTPSRLAKLARIVRSSLNDLGWARRLLESAEIKLSNRREAVMLADTIREIFNDNDWMNRVFLKAETHCKNRFQYEYLIQMVDLKSGDGKLLSMILKRAEMKLTAAEDLQYLAETILNRFEDEAWAERVHQKATDIPAKPCDPGTGLISETP